MRLGFNLFRGKNVAEALGKLREKASPYIFVHAKCDLECEQRGSVSTADLFSLAYGDYILIANTEEYYYYPHASAKYGFTEPLYMNGICKNPGLYYDNLYLLSSIPSFKN